MKLRTRKPGESHRPGIVHPPSHGHTGSAPADLGESIRLPDTSALRGLSCTLTRAEYYAFRYGEVPPT